VKLQHGELKSIRDEHLQIVRPAPSSNNAVELDTTAIYRLLCEGGETAVPEAKFLGAVQQLLPKIGEAEWRRLLLLLPKSADGRVDVPETVGQFLVGPSLNDQTIQMGGPLFPPSAGGAAGGVQLIPGPDLNGPMSPTRPAVPRPAPPQRKVGNSNQVPLPGSVQSTNIPGSVQSPQQISPTMARTQPAASGGGDRGQTSNTDRAHGEVSLLRLAQKLVGRPTAPGPGADLLRLFSAQPDEVRLEELNEAVSVAPLGISRAEVQSVFFHLTGGANDSLPIGALSAAIETAYNSGTPAEAAALDGINLARLASALQRLDSAGGGSGRATVQEFRVTLMQAEPYLTANQLEWLMALTDKDGEGRLLPRSLLVRLGAGPANPSRGGSLMVPPRPACAGRAPIAPHTPRSQVVAAILARIRDRLFSAGPQLTLERVLSIFSPRISRPAMVRASALLFCLFAGAAADQGRAFRGARAGIDAQRLTTEKGTVADEGPSASGTKTCMYILAVILVCGCCFPPCAGYLMTQGYEKASGALSCCSTIITIGAFVYVFFFTTIISDYSKGGFAAVGWWCGGLCIVTIIVAVLMCCLLCYQGAVYSGMIARSKHAEDMQDKFMAGRR